MRSLGGIVSITSGSFALLDTWNAPVGCEEVVLDDAVVREPTQNCLAFGESDLQILAEDCTAYFSC